MFNLKLSRIYSCTLFYLFLQICESLRIDLSFVGAENVICSVMNHPETLQPNLLESLHTFLIFRFEVLGGQDGGNQVIGDETISIVEAPVNPPVNLPSISELPGKKIKLSA